MLVPVPSQMPETPNKAIDKDTKRKNVVGIKDCLVHHGIPQWGTEATDQWSTCRALQRKPSKAKLLRGKQWATTDVEHVSLTFFSESLQTAFLLGMSFESHQVLRIYSYQTTYAKQLWFGIQSPEDNPSIRCQGSALNHYTAGVCWASVKLEPSFVSKKW